MYIYVNNDKKMGATATMSVAPISTLSHLRISNFALFWLSEQIMPTNAQEVPALHMEATISDNYVVCFAWDGSSAVGIVACEEGSPHGGLLSSIGLHIPRLLQA